MNKKLILITCFVFCFFITLSAVSAINEEQNQNLTIMDDGASDNLKIDDVESDVSQSNDEEVLGDAPGTFTDLYNLIGDSHTIDGQTITLNRNYTYNPAIDTTFVHNGETYRYCDGIIFTKSITIDGKGFTLSGNNQASILYAGGGESHAFVNDGLLKNINFKDARNTVQSDKNLAFGALGIRGNVTVENCNFTNNYAFCAAAIGIGYSTNVQFTGCNFINNTGYGTGGGAIRFRTQVVGLNIYKCSFKDNYGLSFGGALHSDKGVGNDGLIVNECEFINNKADSGAGALFFQSKNGVLKNSRFIDNDAYQGGAIYWDGYNGALTNCIFIHNNATEGGAIFCSNAGSTSISASKFYNNTATDGGAVYFKNNSVSAIDTCVFNNNSAINQGGAIYCTGQFFKVTNSNFTLDHARQGGGLFLDVGAYVYECNFNEAKAYDGGGIYLYSKVTELPSLPTGIQLGVFSTNFTGCHADHDGGAGYVNSNWGVVKDTILKDCTAVNDGGAGYIKGSYGKLINSQLINNMANGNGGALYWEGNYGSITNTSYRQNRALKNGAGVYWQGYKGNITNCNFTRNDGIGDNSNGGSIYVEGDDLNITCADFKHGSAKDGSAIYIKGENTNVLHSNFTEVGSNIREGIDDDTCGGSIYIEGHNAVIYDDNFKRNNAGSGGAIYIAGNDADISHSTFDFTNVTHAGSAIYISGNGTNITHSSFAHAYAKDNGGAIYIGGHNTHITRSNFRFLNATHGGAIFINGSGNVIQSDFSYCFAVGSTSPTAGGAIYVEGDDNDISNSTFTTTMAIGGNGGAIYVAGDKNEIYNITTSTTVAIRNGPGKIGNGGAVYIEGDDTNITYSRFQFGSAEKGGAIYIEGRNAHIIHSNITQFGAKASAEINPDTKGGGAYIAGYKTVIDDVLFVENNAANGGSLYITGNEATIKNSNFTRTKSTQAGGAMYILGNKTQVENSDFTFSVTGGDGGAVYVGGVGTQISSSTFSFTNATHGGAIYINGNDTCIESNFDHTFARNDGANPGAGGAIFITGDNNRLCNSNFTITMAITGCGGAIYAGGINTTIYNIHSDIAQAIGGAPGMGNGGAIYISGNSSKVLHSTFKHYNATLNGGGLYVEGNNVNISHSRFEYGEALFGAGVYIKGHDTCMEWSNLTYNHAHANGGVIYIEGNHSTIADSRLEYSYANMSGGAVFINGANNQIINSNLTHNNATHLYGGSIYINGDKNNISSSIFEFCTSTQGGAIYINGTEANIIHSNFTQNGINPKLGITEGTAGGAIYIAGSKATLSHDRFLMSQASEGGFIYISGDNALVSHSIFSQSVAFLEGGAIDIHGDDALITESSFMMSNATFRGGAITIEGHGVNITNSNFTLTTVSNNNPQIRTAGGAIYVGGNDCDVVNCKFNITRAIDGGDGGAIYVEGNRTNIKDSNFTVAMAVKGSGGAVYVAGNNLTMDNCMALKTQAIGGGPGMGNGGTVYISGKNVIIKNSDFRQYNATLNGGSVFIKGNGTQIIESSLRYGEALNGGAIYINGVNVTLYKSNLTNNHARVDGGVIYVNGNHANITESRLEYSYTGHCGGTIYINGNNTIIKDSNLTHNNATADGGSIYISGHNTNITDSHFEYSTSVNGGAIYIGGVNTTVKGSTFAHHTATEYGGAIYIAGENTKVKSSNFSYCGAKDGGAIYIKGDGALIEGSGFDHYNVTHDGGAAYIQGDDVNITSSTFEYGEATHGGAIYIKGEGTYVDHSNFTRNHAKEDGGIIYVMGANTKINNSKLEYSYSNKSGGAIYVKGADARVINSNFTNNNATQKMGGSIYVEGVRANITGSRFTNCASREGGALYVKGANATVHNSNFTRNLAQSEDNNTGGGSIYIYGENAVISYSNFDQSMARDGGMIYIRGSEANITHSNFQRSQASRYGGAVFVAGINATIDSSTFTKHNATCGGAVYISGENTRVTSSGFTDSHASSNAGGVYLGPRTTVFNSTFNNNTAEDGGAMYNNGGTAIIAYSNFTDNIANKANSAHGGAIYWKGGSSNDIIIGCRFINNSAPATFSLGGAIFCDNGGQATFGAVIKDSVFYNNSVGRHGGAIDWFRADNGLIENCNFTDNHAYSNGGAIYAGDDNSDGENLTIRNCNFIRNDAGIAAGALCLQFESSHVVNTVFDSNKAYAGGTIYCVNPKASNTEYVNCTFINSTTCNTVRHSEADNGGAVFIATKNTNFTDCRFINCSVYSGKNGGAIYFKYGADGSRVDRCNFTNCTAISATGEGEGGAIYIDGAYDSTNNVYMLITNITIHNSTFINTSARNGGAIYLTGINTVIDNSTFKNNFATNYGGAVYIKAFGNDLALNNTVSNSTFKYNNAVKGGAIYLNAYANNITNSTISDNLATNGAGIYLENSENITIINTNITGNNATRGSGIYSQNSKYSLNGVKLLENQAHAGAFINKTVKMDTDGRYYVTAVFTGNDNLLNAIWNDETSEAVEFNGVTYWDAEGVNTTSTIPDLSVNEAGINITVLKTNLRAAGEVVVTDENGAFKYYFTDNGAKEYEFTFKHIEDKYYTNLEDSTSILTTNVIIEIESIDLGQNATVNVTLKDRDGNNLSGTVRVIINNTHNFTMTVTNGFGSVNNVSGLPTGLYNATVIYEGNESYLGSRNSTTFTVRSAVNVTINKTVDLSNVSVGKLINFTIEIHNSGESTANNVWITDTLPAGLVYIKSGSNATDQGIFDKGVVKWNISTLGPHQTVRVWVQVNTTVNGTFSNVAVVNSTEGGTNSSNTTNVTVNPSVNLTVIKKADISRVQVGDYVNFTITVTNNGPSNATAVVITDVLDSAFEWINATDESRPDANRKITWTINKIANGTNASVWLLVKVLTNGTFTNVACVNCSENKTIITSNDTNVTVDPNVNLTVIKNASVSVAQVGDLINFTITVINHGPSNATMVKISDVLDTAFEWVGSYENIRPDANRKLTWTINQITNGTNTSVWVQVRLLTNGTFTNVATANCSENTTDVPSNDTDVTVNPKVNLTVVKTSDVIGNASVGDLVNFTIIITNHGPSNATDVNVTDYLPIGMIPVKYGANVTGVTITNTTLTNHSITVKWHIDRMINVSSIKLWVLVNLTTNGTFTNVAFANSNENRTNSTNSTNITVNPKVNLTVIKYSNLTGHALVGDLVKFIINVTNHGPSNATNVKIVDELHHDFQFVNASENVRPENGKLTWTIDKLLSGNTTSVWVIVKVMNNGTFTNIAVVNFTETNKTSTNKTNITVDAQVNLTVVKTTENSTANVGDLANFTIIVTNNGLSNATQVNVTDLLPAGLVFVKAGGNVTIASITNTTLSNGTTKVVWNIAKILNGTSIKLWIQVNLTTNGTFTNVAFANSNENTTNSTNSTNITVKPVIDLVINKTVNKTDVQVGDTVTYTITVKNNGPSNATGVYVIDKLDKRLKLIKVIKTQGNYDNVTGKWTIGNITNGGNVTLKLIVQILTNGTIPNFANVTGNENDTNITNNNDTADNITAKPKVNLTVVKTLITTGDIYVGDLINYTITVTNNGPSNATNVQITDNLIPQFRFVLANGTYTNNTQKVNWTIPFIANGTSATVCIQVKVLSNGTLKNIATVNCTENKTDVPSNETNVTVKPQVNLTVIKTIENSTAHVGDLVNFTIIITNNGLSNATNVTVVDLLPLGMIYKNAGSNSTDYNVYNRILPNKTNEVKWVISKIMNGTSVKLWLQVNLTTNGTFRNVAVVNSTENNTNVSNGTNITVKPSVNLIINKTVNKTDAYVGDIVEYTIEITNKGPSNATDVKVTDCLDEKLKYVNSTATSGKYNETTHIWTINNITSGAKVTLKILARIITNGTILNIAIVNCSENTTNKNSSSQNITAKPQVNLTVIKTAQTTGTIYVGDIVNYTITVTNNGLSNATNVTITENLIQAFRFVKANGTYVNNTQKITWTIDKLENGTSKSVWITVKVLTNGTLSNFVVVNSTENTTDVPSNVTNITVTPKVNLTVVKTSDVIGNASVGQLVNFTLIVTNYGPSNATDVNVTDLLPAGMVYKDSGSNITDLKGHVDLTNSSRVIWNIDKIANGTSVKLWLLVNLTTNGTFRNVAVVVSNENKTNTTNGTNITVDPVVDLVINKTVKNVTAYVGDTVEYIIVVTNNGPSNATGVYVFDELDSKLKYVNFTATQGNYNETTHKWVIGNITAGKNVTLTIRAKVIMNGTIPNFANVTGNENDTNITNNNDTSDNITALPKVNLTVVKTSDVIGNASVGQLVNFTIIVTNYGPSNATDVNVTDLLPVGMVYKDSGSNITNLKGHVDLTNSSRVIWNIDKIANGTSVKLWLLVNLTTNGTFRNVAVVVSNENKTNTTNGTNITVKPVVDLVINKTVNNITAYVGDIVEYTIIVTNNGPSNATGVYVFDELDSKLKYVSFTAIQGNYNETTHKWVIGNITAGKNVTLTIRAKVIMNGTIPNFANVAGNENDTNITNNNDTSDNITALPKVNLTVVKTSDVIGNASVGQLVNFTIIVTNYGPSNATGVNVTDLLPAGMIYKDSGSNMTGVTGSKIDGNKVLWQIAQINNGSSVKLWLLVNLTTNGTFRNVAVVVSNENKTNTTNGTNITVKPVVDLVINKTVKNVTAYVGDTVEYIIVVTNNGPSNATGVYVFDELDSKLKYVNFTATQGNYNETTHKWVIGNITAGKNVTLTIRAKVIMNGTIPNFANVTGNENDTNITNNNDTSDNITALPKVNLTVVKTSDVIGNASVGQLVNFTIIVTNYGPSNATDVNVTDLLPAGMVYKDSGSNITNLKGHVDLTNSSRVIWNIDKIANGTSVKLWLLVNLTTNGTFRNVAVVVSNENKTNTTNGTNITVKPVVDLVINKTVKNVTAYVGDTVEYIIVVTNNGPSNATGVYVFDELDSKLKYVSFTAIQGNYNETTHKWVIGNITAGNNVTLTIRAKVIMNGTIPNFANVTGNENDTNITNNNDTSDNVTALPQVNLTVIKTANVTGTIYVGDIVNYTITVTNNGLSNATNVTVVDDLIAAFKFEGSNKTYVKDGQKITWTIDRLENGTSVSFWIAVKVLTNGTLSNFVVVNSTENTTDVPSNVTNVTVEPKVNLTIIKTSDKVNASVGELVNFTIIVTNYGPSNATGVNVTDLLPLGMIYNDSGSNITGLKGHVDVTNSFRVIWNIDNIMNGTSIKLWVLVNLTTNGTFRNVAVVKSNENTTNTTNGTNITVKPAVDLVIVKNVTKTEVHVGDIVEYTITVTNNGPSNATGVYVMDELDPRLEFVNSTETQGKYNATTHKWTIGNITSGVTVTLTIRAKVIMNGTIPNFANVTGNENDTNITNNNDTSDNVTALPQVNLTVIKTVTPANATVGDVVNFTITVVNNGLSNATKVNISDVLNPAFGFIEAYGGATPVNGKLTWTIDRIANGTNASVWIKVRLLTNGTFTNVAVANCSENTTNVPSNDTNITVTPNVNLTIVKSANPANASVGDLVNFTITVTNNGLSNATHVVISDTLDSAFELVKSYGNVGMDAGRKVVWVIDKLENGTSTTVWVQVKLLTNGTFTNIAVVNSTENTTNVPSNETNITVAPKANITIIKYADIAEGVNVSVGDAVKFIIVVKNNGPSNATNVIVTDNLNEAFGFKSSNITCERDGQKVIWKFDRINVNETVTIELIVNAIKNGFYFNVAVVNSTESENVTSNETVVTILPAVNLTAVKKANLTGNASAGDLVNFTITIYNKGPSNATNVNITDTLPSGMMFVDASAGGVNATVDGITTVTWNIGNVNLRQTVEVWVVVKVLANGTLRNTVKANSTENTTGITNYTDLNVTPAVDLAINKTVKNTTAYVGDIVEYIITVTNKGPSNATGVEVFDKLDSKLEYYDSNVSQGSYDKTNHKWIIGNITSGNTVTLTIKAKVIMNGTIANLANVTGNEKDTNKSNDNDTSDNVTALPKVNLTVIKTPQNNNVSVGDLVNFTIVVTNNGLSNATNVKVTDELIEGFGFVNATGNYSRTGQKVVWTIKNIANGTSQTLILTVKVLTNGTLTNAVTVNCSENKTDVPSNTTNVTANPKVNLAVVKYANVSGTVNVGDYVKFTINVTNNGPSNATDVTVVDDLNSAFEIISAPGNRTILANKVTWIIPHLANGTSTSVYVIVKLLTNGTFENVASVKSNENTTNSTNGTNITVKPAVDLAINKTVDKTNVTIGDTVVYTITVKNNGPSNATDVEVTENLKGEVEITANPSKGTYVNNKWTIPLLEANETATLTLVVKVLKAETIENSVVVKANENDTNLTNNNYTSENVTVNKLDTPIKLETENITYGDDEPIKVILPAKATGTVNITVGNVTYPDQPINNGVVELTIPDLAGGEYNVTVTYPGDGRYEGNSTAGKFKVSPRVPVIRIEVVDIMYGEVEVLNVTVNAPGFVNITVNNGVGSIIAGLNHTVQEKNLLRALRFTPYDGEATWKLIRLAVGQYPVTATYLGNENYTSVSADAVFNVRALPSVVNVTADDIYVGEDAIIKVSLTPDATGNVTLTIDGKKYTVNITGGKGHLTVPGLKAGLKNVTVKYEGDEHYLPSENSTTFNVKKIKPPIDVDSEDIYVGEDETITVTLPSDATGTVTITVNGKKYTADVVSGIAEFTIPGLKAGKYTVDASYSGDDKYLPTNGEDNFKVSKLKPDITVDAPDITVGEDGTITVTLPDDATGTVTIEVEGKTYTAKVKNGKAVFKVPGLSVGVHGIKVWYSGDDKYLPTETAGDIYVKPINKDGDSHNQVGLEKHPTGNPIIVLMLVLISMVGVGFRKFKK